MMIGSESRRWIYVTDTGDDELSGTPPIEERLNKISLYSGKTEKQTLM